MEIKPMSMMIKETNQAIIDIINNSGLHISILNYMMQDIATAVRIQAEQFTMQEEEDYKKSLESKEE